MNKFFLKKCIIGDSSTEKSQPQREDQFQPKEEGQQHLCRKAGVSEGLCPHSPCPHLLWSSVTIALPRETVSSDLTASASVSPPSCLFKSFLITSRIKSLPILM